VPTVSSSSTSHLAVTATTRLAAVIGDPVRHSLSPVIHNAGFAAVGFDAVYVALPVASGKAADAIAAMRAFDWLGMSVTMPHKADVMAACDQLTETAQLLNSVNCVFWQGDTLMGDSTDGEGFTRGLAADLDVNPAGLRCVLVGAGGAAGAVARQLSLAGAAQVGVINRTRSKAELVATMAGAVGAVVDQDALAQADLVVNATPIGMGSTDLADAVPFDVALLKPTAVVSDLIYHPAETKLLAAARGRGLSAQNGLSMLVHQAVAAFEHWTGAVAPVEAMAAAAEAAISARA